MSHENIELFSQGIPEEPPISADHQSVIRSGATRFTKEAVIEHLKELHSRSGYYATHFEFVLARKGLLSQLEETGIVPVVLNPNPYDPDIEEDKCAQWWEDHAEEGEEFRDGLKKRQDVLKNLFIGAVLGRSFDELFPLSLR